MICCTSRVEDAMKHLTIRNIPSEVAEALERERNRSRGSLNQTVIELLRNALGVRRGGKRNGLAALAGTWTEEEHERFEAAVAVTEQIDEELWR
jgi:plasmid stability protein